MAYFTKSKRQGSQLSNFHTKVPWPPSPPQEMPQVSSKAAVVTSQYLAVEVLLQPQRVFYPVYNPIAFSALQPNISTFSPRLVTQHFFFPFSFSGELITYFLKGILCYYYPGGVPSEIWCCKIPVSSNATGIRSRSFKEWILTWSIKRSLRRAFSSRTRIMTLSPAGHSFGRVIRPTPHAPLPRLDLVVRVGCYV